MRALVSIFPIICALNSCSLSTGGRWIPSSCAPEDIVVAPMAAGPTLITGTKPGGMIGRSGDGQLQAYCPGKDHEFRTIFQGGRPDTFVFSPVGIAFVERSEDPRWRGASLVYATNKSRRTVEVFEIARGELVHRAALPCTPLLEDPNGIAAFADGTVYVTDFGLIPRCGIERPIVGYVHEGKPENSIVCYTPPRNRGGEGSWKFGATGFNGSNGIAPGPGGTSLLVVSLHSRRVWSIPRDPKTGQLLESSELAVLDLDLDFFPDNLKMTGECHYEIAGHRSRVGAALYFISGLPLSDSASASFSWDGKTIRRWSDRSQLLKDHRRCASTVIRCGEELYVGQPRCAGVFARSCEK